VSSNVSDDMTVEITCPSCEKKFVINTTEIGEMTICPHCSTVMVAQAEAESSFPQTQPKPPAGQEEI